MTLDNSIARPIRRFLIKFEGKISHFYDTFFKASMIQNVVSVENLLRNNSHVKIKNLEKQSPNNILHLQSDIISKIFSGYAYKKVSTDITIEKDKPYIRLIINDPKTKSKFHDLDYIVIMNDNKTSSTSQEDKRSVYSNFLKDQPTKIQAGKNLKNTKYPGLYDQDFLKRVNHQLSSINNADLRKHQIIIKKLQDNGVMQKIKDKTAYASAGNTNQNQKFKDKLREISNSYKLIKESITVLKKDIINDFGSFPSYFDTLNSNLSKIIENLANIIFENNLEDPDNL
ncbi:hypothetical protein TVAG_161650 [Trichomonas vaginalis G3]|uniref:Uncharacterized protein n=1 Tax=Trichomonas vaginalis (strain ATCC PRA-98 / G3) TaxID=412133 RepID=A2EUN8_TRIV3|nr:hypothetical protein TVAGG3_0255740 [Trichomonas vaginalis G3]EAY03626.1 hypothetical protein TVAG_161650 [Trichomonas vaginalis G3]KAI5524721.1 hypothetical protein TVAGG3_0255740 [Trichomonas vaginalis G3]|eukprot:XP_001315849.1 hypothetical protein [Trichomonas vaginalis G3]